MKLSERRFRFRKGLHSLYLPIYDGLCEILGPEWQPYCGLRTIQEQELLYQKGRAIPGEIVTNARGGESAHNYGCASDWTVWTPKGIPQWPNPKDPKWKELGQACEKVGGDWGGNFRKPDCPHVQLGLTLPWKKVSPVWAATGMLSAMEFVQEKVRC